MCFITDSVTCSYSVTEAMYWLFTCIHMHTCVCHIDCTHTCTCEGPTQSFGLMFLSTTCTLRSLSCTLYKQTDRQTGRQTNTRTHKYMYVEQEKFLTCKFYTRIFFTRKFSGLRYNVVHHVVSLCGWESWWNNSASVLFLELELQVQYIVHVHASFDLFG